MSDRNCGTWWKGPDGEWWQEGPSAKLYLGGKEVGTVEGIRVNPLGRARAEAYEATTIEGVLRVKSAPWSGQISWLQRKVEEAAAMVYGPPELEQFVPSPVDPVQTQFLPPSEKETEWVAFSSRHLAQAFGLTPDEIRGVTPPPPDAYAAHRRKLEASGVELPPAPAAPARYVSSLDEDFWIPDAEPEGIVPRPGGRKKPINTDEALRARLAEVTQLSERQANDITLMRTKLARLELVEEAMVTKIATELRDPVAELERELDDIDIDMEGDTIASLGRRSE